MFYSAQKKSHKEFLSWREKKKFWFFIRRKKSEKNEKVKHLIQMGKIGNISAISVPTQFEFVYLCFCFEFTIFWNLFSEHVFYVSVRLVRREQFVRAENQSLCRSFTCFCCLYWIPCSFDRFEERQIELAKSCVLIGPYRSLLNFYEHSKLNCKTYFKCQLSTVNV